jgi:hypothetical protein
MNLDFLETLQNSLMENNGKSSNVKMPQAATGKEALLFTKTRIELPGWSRWLGLKYTQKVLGA